MDKTDRIIPIKRSVIVAADVGNIGELKHLAQNVQGVPGIGGFKIGFRMAFKGIDTAVSAVRCFYNDPFVPIIYDHQKAGNDIPNMGKGFANDLANAGVTAVILFPFAGPVTQEVWIKSCFDAGLQVMVGGIMTHQRFLVSEGGYIADEAVERIYLLACRFGVRHFIVPGNKLKWVKKIRGWLIEELGEDNFVLYAPGFIDQTGDINECAQVAGDEWHAIVGSAIYEAKDIHKAAMNVTSQII